MEKEQTDEEIVEELMKTDDGFNPNSPIPREQQLEHKRAIYRELLEMRPMKEKIPLALETILQELPKKVSPEQQEEMLAELDDAGELLASSPEIESKKLGISEETFDMLYTIGEEKFDQNPAVAVAIFTLLAVLDSGRFRNWYLLGQAELAVKNYDEAIRAFENCNKISEAEPVAHLLLTGCYIEKLDFQQALSHLESGKRIMQNAPENPEWQGLAEQLDAQLQNKI